MATRGDERYKRSFCAFSFFFSIFLKFSPFLVGIAKQQCNPSSLLSSNLFALYISNKSFSKILLNSKSCHYKKIRLDIKSCLNIKSMIHPQKSPERRSFHERDLDAFPDSITCQSFVSHSSLTSLSFVYPLSNSFLSLFYLSSLVTAYPFPQTERIEWSCHFGTPISLMSVRRTSPRWTH